MSDPTTDQKQVSLAEIAASLSKIDASFSLFHTKVFSFIVPRDESSSLVGVLRSATIGLDAFPNRHPAIWLLGNLSTLVPLGARAIFGIEKNELRIDFRLDQLDLPNFEYFAIVSPVTKSGSASNYKLAFESINFLRSLLTLPFGNLATYAPVAECDFDATGQIHVASDYLRMPRYADLFRCPDAAMMSEVASRLAVQQSDFRLRLQRACNFLATASSQRDEAFRFSSLWIALEVLVAGKGGAIRSRLAKVYGQRDLKIIDHELRFKEISDIRHALIHRGEFRVLKSYQERLMHLYFWDIAFEVLGVKPRHLSLALVKSGLIDLENKSQPSTTS